MPRKLQAFDVEVVDKEEISQGILNLAYELWCLSSTAYGPKGQFILVQANELCGDAFVLTSSASRILDRISLDSSVGVLMAHFIDSHLKQYRDGGHLCILLVSKLLLELFSERYFGLHLALEWSVAAMAETEEEIEWQDEEALVAAVRGIVAPKSVANAPDSLCKLLVQTFVGHIPWLLHHPTERPLVKVVQAPSQSTAKALSHTALVNVSCPRAQFPLANVIIALFSVTIRPSVIDTPSDLKITLTVDTGDYHLAMAPSSSFINEAEMLVWRRIADKLHDYGVHLVLSQKKIPAFLATYLNQLGIAAIERLSIHHIENVQAVSGARMLSDWIGAGITKDDLGFLSEVSHVQVGDKKYIGFVGRPTRYSQTSRTRPVSTLIMPCDDTIAFDELDHVVQAAMYGLTTLLVDPAVVPGAGVTETYLVKQLRLKATALSDHRQLVRIVECVADALDSIPAVEATFSVLDGAAVKRSALTTALTLVMALLRLESAVVTAP
ncbi:hypothetical protein LEN26_010482 [Aphanomyces euteiches]|nr:hypothetical protein AeMF1_012674 [Aphanomyces euteiches]KAH9121878.1 hypothetical protein LEN26_010482 [Aphanomyces euteiches]KAH9189398.1 hypothetical protein AeNC1_008631 [Aphanomyces euteiches]